MDGGWGGVGWLSVFEPQRLLCSFTGRKRERERERMSLSDWHLAVKLADQPLAPKSILRLPETELGEYSLGGYSISFLKQLIAGKLQESVPDPELIGESVVLRWAAALISFGEDSKRISRAN